MTRSDSTTLPFRSRSGILARLTLGLSQALTRRRERQALGNLDTHILRDIGLTPEQAQGEAAKPFWRA